MKGGGRDQHYPLLAGHAHAAGLNPPAGLPLHTFAPVALSPHAAQQISKLQHFGRTKKGAPYGTPSPYWLFLAWCVFDQVSRLAVQQSADCFNRLP